MPSTCTHTKRNCSQVKSDKGKKIVSVGINVGHTQLAIEIENRDTIHNMPSTCTCTHTMILLVGRLLVTMCYL